MEIEERLYRVFQMIRYLNTPPGKTMKQLQYLLNCSNSQVYRIKDLLEHLGYPIDKDEKNRYFLQFSFPRSGKTVFQPDELFFLQDHLQQVSTDSQSSPLVESILHKLNLNLSLIPLADALPQLHASRIIQLIRSGLDTKTCLLLKKYRSLTSDTVADRRVEPLELTLDHRYLIAWDLDKDDQRQFKINRIEDVDFLEISVLPRHIPTPMDLFGLTGPEWLPVSMKLSKTAYHLLIEEFPLSRPHIRRGQEAIIFDGMVRNWKGIGRFVLGLPEEVEVLAPEEFKEYLERKVREWGGLRSLF